MSEIVREQELRQIITGAALLGSGGGGSPKDGLKLLDELISQGKAEVTLITNQEMAEDEWAVMVAEMGAPKVFREAKSFPETVIAFNRMQEAAAHSGRRLKYLMAGELGGFNTMVPLYVAALEGVPFVDADGNGRAVPELGADLYAVGEVPHSPITMASNNGDSVVVYLNDPLDHKSAESILRHISVAYGQLAAFCTYVVNRDMIVDKLAPGTMTLCMAVGMAFREADSFEQLSRALEDEVGAKKLFVGSISNVDLKSEGGFDLGITHLDGAEAYAGRTVSIGFKNENMLLREKTGEVIATVPDLIMLVDVEGLRPLTNADTKPGQKVAVFGATAPSNWFNSPTGVECWRPILQKFGYDGDYVPVR
jgi:DUF917 family protein